MTALPPLFPARPIPFARRVLIALLAATALGGCGEGENTGHHTTAATASDPADSPTFHAHESSAPARAMAGLREDPRTADAPSVEDPRTGQLVAITSLRGSAALNSVTPVAPRIEHKPAAGNLPSSSLTTGTPPIARGADCVVDFTDTGALTLTEASLWFDRIYMPWFQTCNGTGYVDVRPLRLGHVHLGFADPQVLPCNTDPQAFPSRFGDDGSCLPVDIPTEPRTHITTHGGHEIVRVTAYRPDGSTLAAFDLDRIRILFATPVRLCYRKRVQGLDGDWLAYQVGSATEPAIWLCWSNLSPATWNLSDWATDVTEVRITAADGHGGGFTLDDLHIDIR